MADVDSSAAAKSATAARASESWADSLVLFPRRTLFVAVALVQIGVELAVGAVRATLARTAKSISSGDDGFGD